jgi:major inositol transporter-like SP family MFS transporter
MALLDHHRDTLTTTRPQRPEPSATSARGIRRRVIAAAAIPALGGMLFGYDTGVVSGALLFLKNDLGGLSSFQQELVTSLLLVGAMGGALTAGRVADAVGRRKTILVTAVIFVAGVLLAAFAPTLRVRRRRVGFQKSARRSEQA